jgi:hypothetical protein
MGMKSIAWLFVAWTLFAGDAPAVHKLEWELLRTLNYRTGEQSAELKKTNGQVARVPGFMIPLEDDAEMVSEFLLVPYVGACIHTPPPPPNQIVHVKVENGRKTKLSFWDPVWVEGKFEVVTVKSPYGDVSFKMTAIAIEPYKD